MMFPVSVVVELSTVSPVARQAVNLGWGMPDSGFSSGTILERPSVSLEGHSCNVPCVACLTSDRDTEIQSSQPDQPAVEQLLTRYDRSSWLIDMFPRALRRTVVDTDTCLPERLNERQLCISRECCAVPMTFCSRFTLYGCQSTSSLHSSS